MKAGRLRYRVMLQKPAEGRLPSGQPNTGWVDVKSVRADITDVSGRELLDSGAEVSGTTTRIWIRKYPDIALNASWQITHLPPTGNNEVYNVKNVISAENGKRLEILCETGVKK
ncbi:phage head closure protein [Rouxiella badensis]|uniref:phage head closure protein n=1 Tax=Rouxiella badensis TaxID=1646377 RepID=UPI001D14EE44|nr:phage head closure protein [Rouxiella badensis]MCC3703484.1 phage head closure protein [Rouxiella badensis]